jgi:membrane glycosyltransferase
MTTPLPIDPTPVLPTAPRVTRGPMRPAPWFGFLRGLLFALWPGVRFPAAPNAAPAWQRTAERRRRTLLVLVAALSASAIAVQWAHAPADPGVTWWAYTALLALLFAWVGAGFVTALMGAWVLWRGDPWGLQLPDERAPIDRSARTAVIMPICNEDITTVFGGLRATAESVAATGALALFDFYVLSDTADPTLRAAELRAWERLRTMMGDDPVLGGGRIFYRWRRRRTKRKAGNVADFCRRWGRQYRYMVVLDADSTMRGDTLVSLVRLMEAHPKAGIVQTLPQPVGHGTAHARAQQFAHRVTGRLFSLGMAYWQLGDSHYWGHNAILRVEPFMKHCALARLPGRGGLSGDIMSHDFVEAAMMARAGHEVWLAPQLDGSWEQNPPHLLDELQRDRRWCQGNLQNARLIAEPGWRPVHRVMFGTAAFSYAVAPLWLAFLALGLAGGATGSGALWGSTLALLLLPRVLGVAAVVVRRETAQHGGFWRLASGAVAEGVLSALQAPLRMLAHSVFVLGALTGLKLDWKSPSRQAEGVSWGDAWARIGRLSMPALLLAMLTLGLSGFEAPEWWPMLVPLALAVPFTVMTANPRLGARLERLGLLTIPEVRRPPRTLARAGENRGFLDLVPKAVPAVVRGVVQRTRPRGWVPAAATAALVFAALPEAGVTPELPAALRAERQLVMLLAQAAPIDPPTLAEPRRVRERPARMIDDAVRARAFQAVREAMAAEVLGEPT